MDLALLFSALRDYALPAALLLLAGGLVAGVVYCYCLAVLAVHIANEEARNRARYAAFYGRNQASTAQTTQD